MARNQKRSLYVLCKAWTDAIVMLYALNSLLNIYVGGCIYSSNKSDAQTFGKVLDKDKTYLK